ncbi:MAG: TAXI family TRAP transporter solute-binding subunit [Burkholderiales bacterium]|nr:TAXI family TRAP transporter solute-binding subunit [Burkholderiales bacterium]
MKPITAIFTSLLVCISACSTTPVPNDFGDKLMSIGTASEIGVFHPIGKGICNLVNENREATTVRCIAYTTGGPDYNAQAVGVGDLKLGFAFSALSRTPFPTSLRHVLTVYEAPIALLVKKDAGIKELADLRGKRMNIGSPTSGKRLLIDTVFKSAKLSIKELSVAKELETNDMVEAFCNNEIDAVIEAFSTPNPIYDRLIKQCDGELLALNESVIAQLIKDNPKLEPMNIRVYDSASKSETTRTTAGQKIILVAQETTDPEAVYRFLKSLLTDIDRVRAINPLLADFDVQKSLKPVSGFPSHEGVKRYIKSSGIKGDANR